MVSPDIPRFAVAVLLERQLRIARHSWAMLLASVFEPLLYLLSLGIGLGALVDSMPGISGGAVSYAQFVASGLVAVSAMNAAINETTYAAFSRLYHERVYDSVLTTPARVTDIIAGEIGWAVLRALIAAAGFLVVMAVMALISSPWALLALPAAALIGFTFGAIGLAVTTFTRDWADFQFLQLVLLPMFLFATTFYPLSVYPAALHDVVRLMPLYASINLVRDPLIDTQSGTLWWAAGYLLLLGVAATAVARSRLTRRLIG